MARVTDRTAPASLVLVQGLVNTLDVETGDDALGTPEGVAEFLRAYLPAEPGGTVDRRELAAPSELAALRELREALRAACFAHAGGGLPPERAAALARMLSGAPLVLRIAADGSAALRPADGLHGLAALTARIAAGIAEASADGHWQRLKACEAEDCRWAYYDRSPAGRGRWCTMASCGSRAKMRAYRARQQGGQAD